MFEKEGKKYTIQVATRIVKEKRKKKKKEIPF